MAAVAFRAPSGLRVHFRTHARNVTHASRHKFKHHKPYVRIIEIIIFLHCNRCALARKVRTDGDTCRQCPDCVEDVDICQSIRKSIYIDLNFPNNVEFWREVRVVLKFFFSNLTVKLVSVFSTSDME